MTEVVRLPALLIGKRFVGEPTQACARHGAQLIQGRRIPTGTPMVVLERFGDLVPALLSARLLPGAELCGANAARSPGYTPQGRQREQATISQCQTDQQGHDAREIHQQLHGKNRTETAGCIEVPRPKNTPNEKRPKRSERHPASARSHCTCSKSTLLPTYRADRDKRCVPRTVVSCWRRLLHGVVSPGPLHRARSRPLAARCPCAHNCGGE